MLVQDLSNGFCSETLRAVEDRARERGVVVMAASIDEDEVRERELIHGLVARRIDGLILMPTERDLSWLQVDLASGLVVVTVDRRPVFPELDGVVVDNQEAAAQAVGHLMSHGHRRIALLGDSEGISTAAARRDGYRAALRASGLRPEARLERMGLRSRADATAAVTEMLAMDEPPTAIFAARNVICEGALMALQQLGRTFDVALLGFDEVGVAELVDPAITVMRQDTYEIGTRAIDLLLARLDGDDSPTRVEVVPSTLVARGSGEIPVSRDVAPVEPAAPKGRARKVTRPS
jgi:LacI family transcriptional regulator